MRERRQEIVNFVNRLGEVSFIALKERFPDVSEVTLRKDLKALDADKRLIRICGGAKSIDAVYSDTVNYYAQDVLYKEEKKMIAQKAVKLLQPYDSMYLAAGSTCSAIARELPGIPLKIFTDGLETAMNLAKQDNLEVTLLGGQVEAGSMQLIGPKVLDQLEELQLDYAFCGTLGYKLDYGFRRYSEHTLALAHVLRKRADKLIIVMDSSKVMDTPFEYNFEEKYVDILISDGKLGESTETFLASRHVEVL